MVWNFAGMVELCRTEKKILDFFVKNLVISKKNLVISKMLIT